MSHLSNFANKTEIPIPAPSKITQEEARSLNLVVKRNFICGQKVFDEPIINQLFGIFSFVPAKDATPNSNGIYGFGRIRGCHATLDDATDAAEKIVMTRDQLSTNVVVRVCAPFPICTDAEEHVPVDGGLKTVDVSKDYSEASRQNAIEQKKKDEKVKEELQARKEALVEGVEDVDDLHTYCVERSKLAHQATLISEMKRNIKDMEDVLLERHEKRIVADLNNPTFQKEFIDRIKKEEGKFGFKLGQSPEMDERVRNRWDNLLNYQKIVPHLFPEYDMSENVAIDVLKDDDNITSNVSE